MNRPIKTSLLYGLLQIFFWSSACLCFSFAAFYLGNLGFSNGDIGILVALANMFSVGLSLWLSSLLDRKQTATIFSTVRVLTCIQLASVILVLSFSRRCFAAAAGFTAVMLISLTINPIYVKLYTNLNYAGYKINFASSRGAGSVAFAITSVLTGKLIAKGFAPAIPILCFLCIALQLAASEMLKAELNNSTIEMRAQPELSSYRVLARENRKFFILILGLSFIFAAANASNTYTVNIISALGGEPSLLGAITGFSVLTETVPMLIYGKTKNTKLKPLLMVSILFFPIKLIFLSCSRSITELFFAFSLQSVSFGLFTPVMVDYIGAVIPPRDSGKAQSLALNMQTLGTVIATFLSGVLLDCYPVHLVLMLLAGISLIGVLLSAFGIFVREK